MVKIESAEQFKCLAAKARQGGFTFSNCYFTSATLQPLIDGGLLWSAEFPSALLFLEKADGFYRVYYYLQPDQIPERVSFDRPAVLEYVYRSGLSAQSRAEIALIEHMGFALGRESGRMSLRAGQAAKMPTDTSFVCRTPAGGEEALLALFGAAFDPLYAYMPDRSELTKAIEGGQIFCINEQGRLCAALFSEQKGSTAWIRMIAVAPDAQGRGFAKGLLDAYHQAYVPHVTGFSHWVERSNIGALSLYRKFGYTFDGRYANEYVFRPDKYRK